MSFVFFGDVWKNDSGRACLFVELSDGLGVGDVGGLFPAACATGHDAVVDDVSGHLEHDGDDLEAHGLVSGYVLLGCVEDTSNDEATGVGAEAFKDVRFFEAGECVSTIKAGAKNIELIAVNDVFRSADGRGFVEEGAFASAHAAQEEDDAFHSCGCAAKA